ncbi:response regulator transcription factor [Bradyrhizobium sp.]|uniref:response regulator n=1 Tax=Bradyrhizobium sp. TaxID=376 RepID=UPI001EBC979C|nr:response regulator transcription factor [Bradyrhizobium sp.]MBV9481187.1 response regulator transcription factor [Acidobacteriota bacterium]MBV9982862.1 response regulator transcription factor [Bradyrhizobium sp.]
MKRILIADDHDAVRCGIRAVLEQRPGWNIAAEAADGKTAFEAALKERPDVAIVDFSMPRMTGLEVTRRIKKHLHATEVLIFTAHDSHILAQEAFQAGARAFLAKSDANKLLLAAVESLMAHRPFCGGRFFLRSRRELEETEGGAGLSPRERLVVKLVAEGHSNKGISTILSSSVKTTEAHRASAMDKLGVNSVAGLVRYAVRAKLIE